MILSESAYRILGTGTLVVGVLALFAAKIFTRAAIHNDQGKRAAAFGAVFFLILIAGVNFKDYLIGEEGNSVWVLRPSSQAVAVEKMRLLGSAELRLSNGALLGLKENPREWEEGGVRRRKDDATIHLVNDSDAELFVDVLGPYTNTLIQSTVPARGAASFEDFLFADRVEIRGENR